MARKSQRGAPPPEPGTPAPGDPGAQHDPLESQFNEATQDDWHRLLLRKESGALVDCWQNVYLHLVHHPAWKGVIWRDEFSNRIVRRMDSPIGEAGPWTEEDLLEVGYWLSQQGDHQRLVVKAKESVEQAVVLAAKRARFHPVRDWLKRLKWDGTQRLGTWLTG